MAEGFAKKILKGVEIVSAGIKPAVEINPNAVIVMEEISFSIKDQYPKVLSLEMVKGADLAVTMGCIDKCPLTPREITVDWGLEDPVGKNLEFFRKTRDEIKRRIEELKN